MNYITWLTGEDEIGKLQQFAQMKLGVQYTDDAMIWYLAGCNNLYRERAQQQKFLFLKSFYHRPEYPGIYKLLRELLQQGVTIAIASEEAPHEYIKHCCIVNPVRLDPDAICNEAIPSLEVTEIL